MSPKEFRVWDIEKQCWAYFTLGIANYDIVNAKWFDESKLGQYTGLTDKSGQKIYEGDKIRTAPITIREVVFKDGAFVGKDIVGMYADEKNRYKPIKNGCGEVIGNIYQNEDLLSESQR